MKGDQLDDLFREKLRQHKITPPANAWGKIEGNLEPKKKGAFFWLSIAASIAIVLTLGGIYVSQIKTSSPELEQLQANKEITKEDVKAPEATIPKNEVAPEEDQTQQKEADNGLQVISPQPLAAPSKLVSQLAKKPSLEITEPVRATRTIINIDKIDINQALTVSLSADFDYLKLDPLALRDFTNESYEIDMPRKNKFSMIDGLISIAKGVSKTKETLSDLRATKNEFVTNELKYGVDVVANGDSKLQENKQEK
ncbi:hypothetical protein ACV07N_06875 [Roseivirga echinicomitans]